MTARGRWMGISTTLLVVPFLLLGAARRGGSSRLNTGVPRSAESLWQDCITLEQAGRFAHTEHQASQAKHGKIIPWHAVDGSKRTFGDLVDKGAFVGQLRNGESSSETEWSKDWSKGPQGTSCIFMGGEKTGVWATIVYRVGGQAKMEERELAARFRRNPHPDDAEWDPDIEASMKAGEKKMAADSVTQILVFVKIPGAKVLSQPAAVFRAGPWFVCAEYTCCKAL